MRQIHPAATWFVVLASLLIGLVGPGVGRTVGADSAPTAPSHPVYLPMIRASAPNFAGEVIVLTNLERIRAGCPPLRVSQQLMTAAQRHSDDMALSDFFGHTGSDGSTPWDRIHDTGYLFWMAAENAAAGYATPESVIAGWMASSGHRDNILNCGLTEIGVGYAYLADDPGAVTFHHYWTQDFATPQ